LLKTYHFLAWQFLFRPKYAKPWTTEVRYRGHSWIRMGKQTEMNTIILTAFVGLALVSFFLAFFLHETDSGGGSEQNALIPFDDENPRRSHH